MKIQIGLEFGEQGYVAKPFWPETNTIINVMKDVHPKLGEEKKQKAIAASCTKQGITVVEFAAMQERAKNPFYTVNGRGSEIVIPQRIFQSFLNHTSSQAPKAIPRIESKGLTFIGVKVDGGFFRTGKTEKDAQRFQRFVKNEESNQRMWADDAYIFDFAATGTLTVDPNIITPENLRKLVEWGGVYVGIGGARPQGFGRFAVIRWE